MWWSGYKANHRITGALPNSLPCPPSLRTSSFCSKYSTRTVTASWKWMRLVVTQRACHRSLPANIAVVATAAFYGGARATAEEQECACDDANPAHVRSCIQRQGDWDPSDQGACGRGCKCGAPLCCDGARPQRLLSLWQDLFFKHPRVLRCFSQLLGVGRSESNTMEKANEIGRLLLGDPSLSMSKKPSFRMRVELDNDALVRGATTAAAASSGDVNVAGPAGWPETTPQV